MEEVIKIPDALKEAWAAVGGFSQENGDVHVSGLYPVTEEAEAVRAANAGLLKNARQGMLVPGEGVYVGKYVPKDRKGNSLGKIFNVYAAPEDLTDVWGQTSRWVYRDAVRRIEQLEEWHGHHGCSYRNDSELLAALKDGSYDGGWVIPPIEVLAGFNVKVEKCAIDNLYALKEEGDFKDTFLTWYYLSCTEAVDAPSDILVGHFRAEGIGYTLKGEDQFSCRPVRFVEVKT